MILYDLIARIGLDIHSVSVTEVEEDYAKSWTNFIPGSKYSVAITAWTKDRTTVFAKGFGQTPEEALAQILEELEDKISGKWFAERRQANPQQKPAVQRVASASTADLLKELGF